MGFIVLVPLILLSDRFEYWAKDHLLPLVKEYHPIGHIRETVLNLKNRVNHPSQTMALPIGFLGTRVEKTDGLVSWISPFSDRIPPGSQPPSSKINLKGKSRPLSLIALKGETISFQVVMRSKDPMQDITISLLPDESSPAASCLTVHRFLEKYLRLMVHSGGKLGGLTELSTPDPLIPFHDPYAPERTIISSFSLKPETNQPIWFDIYFSPQCRAGSYNGTLEIQSQGRILRDTPVTFNLLNATLPDRVDLDRWMELYDGRFRMGELIQNDMEYQKVLNRYFLMAHQYGFATNSCSDIAPNIQWDWNTGKSLSVNWSLYDKIYDPLLSGRLTASQPNIFCLPVGTESLSFNWGGFTIHGGSPTPLEEWNGIPEIATEELARVITQHWKDKGWPIKNAFAFPYDEPAHELFYPYIYQVIAKVNHALHVGSDYKMRVMLTDAPYAWGKNQRGHNKHDMYNGVDIWAPGSAIFIPDRFAKYQSNGKRTWFYQSGPPFIGASDLASTGVGFRMWFWTAWKYRINGVFYWASDFYPGNTKASNPYKRQGTGDGVVFYPGNELHFIGYPDIDGPIPSIRMAQWRRGYEDYKYFVLLKEKGRGADVDKIVNSLVHRALDDGGYIPYWRNPLWQKPGDWSHDAQAWHKARVKLAREIATLYASGN